MSVWKTCLKNSLLPYLRLFLSIFVLCTQDVETQATFILQGYFAKNCNECLVCCWHCRRRKLQIEPRPALVQHFTKAIRQLPVQRGVAFRLASVKVRIIHNFEYFFRKNIAACLQGFPFKQKSYEESEAKPPSPYPTSSVPRMPQKKIWGFGLFGGRWYLSNSTTCKKSMGVKHENETLKFHILDYFQHR